jgi:hypothetical protein
LGTLKRGARNILRNPIRLVLVVLLLGTSPTFAAAMVAMNGSISSRVARARGQIGNTFTVRPAGDFGGGFGLNGSTGGQRSLRPPSRPGTSPGSGSSPPVRGSNPAAATRAIQAPVATKSQIAATKKTPRVARVTGQVTERYGGTALKGGIIFSGFGRTFSPPPLIAGIQPGVNGQTLLGGGSDRGRHGDRILRLSAGQQQRVAIARALANRPAVILVDEPTGNLDSKNGQRVDLLRELADSGQATIILVTHDRAIAARADRRLEMEDGKIVREVLAV